ncbi:hypothetical protein FISHEDRAFT_76440 [Fistulina hepatica ATCC 64428]|uniref:G-patch domain-containing protein n=1 Tax=Fistulina hepatica ATCC 64428 TaxID=1128425 RepID=A0A0D7A6Q1_9AGAR|nr:hypothetical protein FISHEDRAFT_76440 [Fistulina hepatica ATCC 64428]
MPLDSHSFLVAQGWAGKGVGLRHGAISRPIPISQKKSLSGVGKDRDEAFPFWDQLRVFYFRLYSINLFYVSPCYLSYARRFSHARGFTTINVVIYFRKIFAPSSVFTAASASIQIKIHADSDSGMDTADEADRVVLKRTSTGILCNRRPVSDAPVLLSDSWTPLLGLSSSETASSSGASTPSTSRVSLLVVAKREAAKRGLYSRFFRGGMLRPDNTSDFDGNESPPATPHIALSSSAAPAVSQKSTWDEQAVEAGHDHATTRKKGKKKRRSEQGHDEVEEEGKHKSRSASRLEKGDDERKSEKKKRAVEIQDSWRKPESKKRKRPKVDEDTSPSLSNASPRGENEEANDIRERKRRKEERKRAKLVDEGGEAVGERLQADDVISSREIQKAERKRRKLEARVAQATADEQLDRRHAKRRWPKVKSVT